MQSLFFNEAKNEADLLPCKSFSSDNTGELFLKCLSIPTQSGFSIIPVEEIIYCEARRSYSRFALPDNRYIVTSKALLNYEAILISQNFFRIHKSYLINLNHVEQYIRGAGGVVVMSNGMELDVSRRKKDDFLKRINQVFR